MSLGGTEFYPSCTQILISGSQTGTPNQTVSFLGAYNDNDPGICDPSVYHNTLHIFSGPPLSNSTSLSSETGFDVGPSSPTATEGSGNSREQANVYERIRTKCAAYIESVLVEGDLHIQ
jgi:hypothetical protein